MPRRQKDEPIRLPTNKQLAPLERQQQRQQIKQERLDELNNLRRSLNLPPFIELEDVPPSYMTATYIDNLKERVHLRSSDPTFTNPPIPTKRVSGHNHRLPTSGRIEFHFKGTPAAIDHLRSLTLPYAKTLTQQDSETQIAGLIADLSTARPDEAHSVQTRIAYLRNTRVSHIGSRVTYSQQTGDRLWHREPTPHRKIGLGLNLLVQRLLAQEGGPHDTRPDNIKEEDIGRLTYMADNPSSPWRGPIWNPETDPNNPRLPHAVSISQATYDGLLRIAYLLHVTNHRGDQTNDSRVRATLEAIALGWIS